MGQMKNYLLLLQEVAPDAHTQDAILYAIGQGWVQLTYNLNHDRLLIQAGLHEFVRRFDRVVQDHVEQLKNSYLPLRLPDSL